MTDRGGHGGNEIEQLRAELAELRAELEYVKQLVHAEEIVYGAAAPPLPAQQQRPKLRLIQGGAVAAALVAGVDWLRRHREVAVALVVAGVAAAAAWLMWPSNDLQPSVEPPGRTTTVTVRVAPPPSTSVSPLPTPRTAAPTPTPTTEPTTVPTGATEPTSQPTVRSPAPITRPTDRPTVTPPSVGPSSVPTPEPTTAPPTTRPPDGRAPCLVRLRVSAVVGVCVRL